MQPLHSNQANPMPAELREMFRQAYLFRQKYLHPTGTEQFWRNAAAEMALHVQAHSGHPFARDLFLACYVDIEREWMECTVEHRTQTTLNLCRR